jgi:hypothetical protein
MFRWRKPRAGAPRIFVPDPNDAVNIIGFECGGHPGINDVTTFAVILKAARFLSIPVLVGVSVVDARVLLALLADGLFCCFGVVVIFQQHAVTPVDYFTDFSHWHIRQVVVNHSYFNSHYWLADKLNYMCLY